ncbi:MAG: response regulator [Candidatus Saccharibacteria bacterium]|nr:response regulator [Candidatus Saccharibacteria bacterium]
MPSKSCTILIVEDDEWFAASLEAAIQTALPEVNISTTGDPAVAMTLIDDNSPNLLLADLHLGERNFFTLLNELASYPDTLALPKIILSSSGGQLRTDDLVNYGIAAIYDKKTYNFNDLLTKIKELINYGK